MGIVSRITQIFHNRNSIVRATDADSVRVLDGSLTEWPWLTHLPQEGMGVSAVYACVKLIAESVATLPLEVWKRDGAIYRKSSDDRMAWVLQVCPNPDFSAFDFWRHTIQQVLLHGNAYIIPRHNLLTGALDWLTLCSPGACYYDKNARIYRVNDPETGIRGDYYPREVIHIRNVSHDGRIGQGIISYAATTIDIAKAGDNETRKRFKLGGNVRGFFTNAGATASGYNPHTDKALKTVAAQKEAYFSQGGNLSYLPGNMQFKELMMSSADMQFLESRKFTVVEICRFFCVDPALVYASINNNYKSVELANGAFLSHTLNPLLVQIEQELQRKLFPSFSLRETVRFNRNSMLACDLETKVRLSRARVEAGLDTINEARIADNREPVENGDTVLVSANLKSLEQLLAGGTATEVAEPLQSLASEGDDDKEDTGSETETETDTNKNSDNEDE